MTKKAYLKIEATAENHVESFIHEIRKQADDAQRYGVNLSVERVDLEESDETPGFSNDHE